MSWGLSYFYENLQLDIRKCNTIYAMRASDGRFISIESEFSNYCIEIFYFDIYHEDFYCLSNNVLHVLGTRFFSMSFGNLKIRQCNVI